MIELSSLLFKPVIDRDGSTLIGRIKNAYFSKTCATIAYFVLSSDKDEGDLLLPLGDVQSCFDAIIVQNGVNVRNVEDVDFTLYSSNVLGMSAYTQNGILKGQIQKVEFSKSGKVSKIYTDKDQFTPQNVASVGDVLLLKSQKQSKPKTITLPRPESDYTVLALRKSQNQPPSQKSIQTAQQPLDALQTSPQQPLGAEQQLAQQSEQQPFNAEPTSLQPIFAPIQIESAPMAIKASEDSPYFSNNALKLLDAPESEDDCRTPARIISDYTFLLGRVLTADLKTYTGATIAGRGTIVDDSLVEKSRLSGKLVDLVLLAKLP